MYIGLLIDCRLNWQPHIEYVCNKLRSFLGRLTILKYKLPYNTLRMLYLALADSVIRYGLSSYGRSYKTNLINIFNLQKTILKNIVPKNIKMTYSNDYSYLFQYCKVLPVQNIVKLSILKQEYNNITKLNEYHRNSRLRSLSHTHRFVVPQIKNVYGMRTNNYLLPKIINSLPKHIQDLYLSNPIPIKDVNKYFMSCNNYDYIL
jgi:hypothetical protein